MNERFATEQARLNGAAEAALATTCLAKLGIAATEAGDPTAVRALNMADKLTGSERALPRELPCALGKCGIRLEAEAGLVTRIGCHPDGQSL